MNKKQSDEYLRYLEKIELDKKIKIFNAEKNVKKAIEERKGELPNNCAKSLEDKTVWCTGENNQPGYDVCGYHQGYDEKYYRLDKDKSIVKMPGTNWTLARRSIHEKYYKEDAYGEGNDTHNYIEIYSPRSARAYTIKDVPNEYQHPNEWYWNQSVPRQVVRCKNLENEEERKPYVEREEEMARREIVKIEKEKYLIKLYQNIVKEQKMIQFGVWEKNLVMSYVVLIIILVNIINSHMKEKSIRIKQTTYN